MGNKIDPRCKGIYDEYHECWSEWKKETDWRQYYHEGGNEECNELLREFQFCSKEQIARITGYVPAEELMQIREEVKQRQEQEQSQHTDTKNAEKT